MSTLRGEEERRPEEKGLWSNSGFTFLEVNTQETINKSIDYQVNEYINLIYAHNKICPSNEKDHQYIDCCEKKALVLYSFSPEKNPGPIYYKLYILAYMRNFKKETGYWRKTILHQGLGYNGYRFTRQVYMWQIWASYISDDMMIL